MTQRINYAEQSPTLFKKFIEMGGAVKDCSIEASIQHLVEVRVSQMNGCTFCLDLHIKYSRIDGERELRLHHLAAWRDSTLFIPRERASLAWAEALTNLGAHGVPQEVYERVRTQLSEKEITDLTYVVMMINAWNRINVAFTSVPGAFDKMLGLDKANLS